MLDRKKRLEAARKERAAEHERRNRMAAEQEKRDMEMTYSQRQERFRKRQEERRKEFEARNQEAARKERRLEPKPLFSTLKERYDNKMRRPGEQEDKMLRPQFEDKEELPETEEPLSPTLPEEGPAQVPASPPPEERDNGEALPPTPETPPEVERVPQVEEVPVQALSFASPQAERLALEEYGLVPDDFQGVEPSGTRGFTVGDVERVQEAKQSSV